MSRLYGGLQQLGTRPVLTELIALVTQRARLHREAPATNAAIELVPQQHQLVDALIQVFTPQR